MQVTHAEYNKCLDEQIGQRCNKHHTIIKRGKYGNWCGTKDEFGRYCEGNKYPTLGEQLTIKG